MAGRLLALALLTTLASPASAATIRYYSSFDAATAATNASPSTFTGGVSGTPPTFQATTPATFPGAGNRILLDFTSAAGSASAGTILHDTTYSDVTAGAFLRLLQGAPGTCVGGTDDTEKCAEHAHCKGGGYCVTNRSPILAHATATEKGCLLNHARLCGNVGDGAINACNDSVEVLEVSYGSPQNTATQGGRCSSSDTMDDTVCGRPCTSTSAPFSDCLQGRVRIPASPATMCVRDEDESQVCDGTDCHCINECDERRPNESSCAPLTVGISVPASTPYIGVLRQTNEADPGRVTCQFFGGRLSTTKQCTAGSNQGVTCTVDSQCPQSLCEAVPEVFPRATLTQRVGKCEGGSNLDVGGRNGTACATNGECACNRFCAGGANFGVSCTTDTQCPGSTCPSCTNGTCATTGLAAPYTSRIVPDRMQFGDTATSSQPRQWQMDHVLMQSGSDPTINWRGVTLLVDGGTDAWTDRTGCGTANQGNCFRGGGTPANEPDGNSSALISSNESLTEIVTFANLPTPGPTPLAASYDMAAQDRGNPDTEGIIVDLEMDDGAGNITTGYDPFTGTPTAGSGDGYLFTNNETRGTGGNYEPMPPKVVVANPNGGGALTIAAVNSLRGRMTKNGYVGGVVEEGRLTFGTLEVVTTAPAPVPPNVLPGNKRVTKIGDSRSNTAALYQQAVAELVEPQALYDQGQGGAAMGDFITDLATLLAGGSVSGGMGTKAYIGSPGLAVDVAIIDVPGINTLHNAGQADPANPTTVSGTPYYGIGKSGHCESWTAGGGYGEDQGNACWCPQTLNWYTGQRSFPFYHYVLTKNASFGTTVGVSSNQAYQSPCSTNAECEMGRPNPAGTPMAGTCSGGKCQPGTITSLAANARPADRTWQGIGCDPTRGAVGCSGVCLASNSTARILDGLREIRAIAAGMPTPPTLVWELTPFATASTLIAGDNKIGWYQTRHAVSVARATILADARARGENWIDLYRWMADKCGPSFLVPGNTNTCLDDGIHYRKPTGVNLVVALWKMCLTQTDETGAFTGVTDGICTTGPTCSGGTCQSGLRIGHACTTNADCNYCSAGATGKLGSRCTAEEDCGYFRCVFPNPPA